MRARARALKFKFIRIGGGGKREKDEEGQADSASPATRQDSPGSRSPPFAIPPLFHYSGMDVRIKARGRAFEKL